MSRHPMASRSPVYIATPVDDLDPGIVFHNVKRAAALARLALVEGLHPIVNGPVGWLAYQPRPALEARDMLVGWGCGLVRLVAKHTGGRIWILTYDNGLRSDGTRYELGEWYAARPNGTVERDGTWASYEQAFHVAGLHGLWQSLLPLTSSVASTTAAP